MKTKLLFPTVVIFLCGLQAITAQTSPPATTPKISETISKNSEQITDKTQIPRARREQAYIKLLEGQRFIWNLSPTRSKSGMENSARMAKQSLQKAVELDPTLAEAYTALAELSKNTPPYNIDESILLANIAIKIDKDNFGGHQILAQLYTFKSQLNRGNLDSNQTQKAIAEWKEIGATVPAPNPERMKVLPPEKKSFIANFKNELFGLYPLTIDKDGVLMTDDFDKTKFELIDQVIKNEGDINASQIPKSLTTIISQQKSEVDKTPQSSQK
jgi:hypothetical protein